jgi:SM-20-related protein
VDRFRDDDTRVVSVVLYLTAAWRPEDGGCLRLHLRDTGSPTVHDVAPHAGTLVAFLADRFPHEVMPATRARYSLTGWFRRRS